MATRGPETSKTKSRFGHPLFIAAMACLAASLVLLIIQQPVKAKAARAISAATTLEQLGNVATSPEYELAVLLSRLSVAFGVLAALLVLAFLLGWARNRDLLGRNSVSKRRLGGKT